MKTVLSTTMEPQNMIPSNTMKNKMTLSNTTKNKRAVMELIKMTRTKKTMHRKNKILMMMQ